MVQPDLIRPTPPQQVTGAWTTRDDDLGFERGNKYLVEAALLPIKNAIVSNLDSLLASEETRPLAGSIFVALANDLIPL